jgi:hypothetical protein
MDDQLDDDCRRSLYRLFEFCRRQQWKGYDPYDGLNSPAARILPAARATRTILTQAVKRAPLNLRRLLGIKPDYNPKGIALSMRALLLLRGLSSRGCREVEIEPPVLEQELQLLLTKLLSARSQLQEHWCWGYNFDWQSRAFFAPRGTPNVVCTSTAGHSMLDYFEATGSEEFLERAASSCRFVIERLNRTSGGAGFCFSYTPIDSSAVHNVNLLAAELLARTYSITGEAEFASAASSAVGFTVGRQRDDGSWFYGEARDQHWIDGFHTGFILVSLKKLIRYLGRSELMGSLERGYEFYRQAFFLADGTPGYYHDSLYPIDVHNAAQAVITFSEMTDVMPSAKVLAGRAVGWAIQNLQDPAGFFYFQRHRFYTIRIPYMRWAQAWMLYALSLYLTTSMERENV